MTKQCRGCGETKPLDEYYRRVDSGDGLNPRCKACIAKSNAARYRKNREARLDYQAEYREANRDRIRAHKAEYYARPEVKARRAEYDAEYRARPDVKARRADRLEAKPEIQWEYEFRRRARNYGFDYLIPSMQSFTREDLVWLHGDKCYHCGGEWTELDHWPIPVAQGGMHGLFNAVPSCVPCNRPGRTVTRLNTATSSIKENN